MPHIGYSIIVVGLTAARAGDFMNPSLIQKPSMGAPITLGADHKRQVPDQPIIPFIEGDGIGVILAPS